jgi:hypothetical protein
MFCCVCGQATDGKSLCTGLGCTAVRLRASVQRRDQREQSVPSLLRSGARLVGTEELVTKPQANERGWLHQHLLPQCVCATSRNTRTDCQSNPPLNYPSNSSTRNVLASAAADAALQQLTHCSHALAASQGAVALAGEAGEVRTTR